MKKRITALLIACLAVVSFAACSKDKDKDNGTTSSAGETTSSAVDSTNGDSSDVQEPAAAFDIMLDQDILALALELDNKAIAISQKYELGGFPLTENTYEDENGMYWYEVDPTKYTSYNDLKKELDEVFTSAITDAYLSNFRYVENGGKLYTMDAARGSDISYQSHEMTLVKEASADKAVIEQTVFRKDATSGNAYTETLDFTMVIEDGKYKVSSFVFPY